MLGIGIEELVMLEEDAVGDTELVVLDKLVISSSITLGLELGMFGSVMFVKR